MNERSIRDEDMLAVYELDAVDDERARLVDG